jgi:hypothetical protein
MNPVHYVKEWIDYFFEKAFEPVRIHLQNQRIAALGQVLEGAKGVAVADRVFLRAVTMLEGELGIENKENAELQMGLISHLGEVIPYLKPKKSSEKVSKLFEEMKEDATTDENVKEEMDQILGEFYENSNE